MCNLGFVCQLLLRYKQKLTDLEQSTSLAHCSPLASALLQGLVMRFGVLLNLESSANEYIAAAISHPFFKLQWVPADFVDRCRVLFIRTHVSTETTSAITVIANSATNPEDDFFTFAASGPGHQSTQQSRSDNLLLEYSQYLEDPATKLRMLHKYPNVKALFLKYNTPIPSSAPVERLYSFGGLMHTGKRNHLSDKMFETLLMLKANANLCSD